MIDRFHGLRYHASSRTLRSRVGARVARVELYPAATDDSLDLRDSAVRAIARRNFGRGIQRFVLAWRPDPTAEADRWRTEAETLASLIPIVGLVAVAPADAITPDRVAALESGDDVACWLEVPGGADAEWSGLERAALLARQAGVPTVGRIGVTPAETTRIAAEANSLRLRAVNLLPPQHVNPHPGAACDPFRDASTELLSRDRFLACTAEVVERLDPSIEGPGFGRMAPAATIIGPAWVREGSDGPGLNALLDERGTHQGHRLHEPHSR